MTRFFDVNEINPKLKLLQKRYYQIKKEFDENLNDIIWVNWNGYNDYKQLIQTPYNGWKVAPLLVDVDNIYSGDLPIFKKEVENSYNQRVEFDSEKNLFLFENSKYLPILTSTLFECGVTKRVGISVVFPDKKIDWHFDPDPETQEKIIVRGLWGLDINPDNNGDCFLCLGDPVNHKKKEFKNNEFIFFWGRTKHMVLNTLQTPRYVVLFDQDISRDLLLGN